jgi:amino acid adenylation domain-containing protein
MTGSVPVVVRAGRPLTPMQRPLWVSQRRNPTAPVQNMALLTHIDGPIDVGRLVASFARVVDASDVLRTRIVDRDGTARVTLDAAPPETLVLDLDPTAALAWARDRVTVPIDMAVRGHDSAVLRHPDGTVSWYLALHHTITDATSSALVFEATAAAYHGSEPTIASYYAWAARSGQSNAGTAPAGGGDRVGPEAEAEDPATARGRARWQQAASHWQARRSAPGIERLYQPVRNGSGAGPVTEAARLPVELDDDLATRIGHRLEGDLALLSPDLGWTVLLITVTAAYLHQVAGAAEAAIGLPVHNRSEPETRTLIGPLMEMFPVDVRIDRGDTFRTLHKRVGRAVMATLNRSAPGTAPAGDVAAVVNVIRRGAVGSFGSLRTRTEWVHSGAIDASHLLRVQLTAYQGGGPDDRPALVLDINRGAAGPDHLERASGHFRSLLQTAVEDPDTPVSHPVLGSEERALLSQWETAADFPSETPGLVAELEEALAKRSNVALRDGSRSWTGAELWQRSGQVADALRARGVGPGRRVGIEMDRSAEAVIAILATLRAGGSFVPLDPRQPAARRRSLADRAGCDPVLTTLPLTTLPHPVPDEPPAEDTSWPRPAGEHEAYLLFTSGSTGEPKGVPISHEGIARYLRFAGESYLHRHPMGTEGRRLVVPLFSALTFDLTMTSLFLALLTGGELIVIRPDGPAALAAIAAEPRIDWLKATPSHLEVLARMLPPEHGLTTVVVGGEAFGAGLARRLLAHRRDLTVFNEYGPTEAVVGCMIHLVDPDDLADHHEVPIGRPAPGVTLRIVGPELERVPIGAAGELLISHRGLTAGYLDGTGGRSAEPDADPFVVLDGLRFYRSGDLVRLADPQTAIYLGRIDEQVKVGGIRLEPTEVEDALASHPAVARAAVRLWSPRVAQPDRRCVRCGLPSNVPGASFDEDGVCRSCHDYDRIAPQAEAWFRTVEDLVAKRDEARRRRTGRYDCLHLLSGGKDSTYALYRLVELGFEPYALTLDNGFISEGAKDNVRRSVAELGIDHEFVTTDAMEAIFRDSLHRHSNVCHGCYKTIYTLATTRAVELGIPLIVTGLSRGQLFETRLIPAQFRPSGSTPRRSTGR